MKENLAKKIQEWMSEITAADAAELFMSPYANTELLKLATEEDGPAMWMVNRSDVSSETLEKIQSHPIAGIAQRAQEKLASRKNPPADLPEPLILEAIDFQGDFETLDDHAVEEILGHPQVELKEILSLSKSPKEDHRASCALSLARRLLEYPPTDEEGGIKPQDLLSLTESLLQDSSAYVRSYAARVPLITPELLKKSLEEEKNAQVVCRLLQHSSLTLELLEWALEQNNATWQDPQVQCVLAIDERVPLGTRHKLVKEGKLVNLAEAFHDYLSE